MCGCHKVSMLSLGDCSKLTEARSPKTGDATREVDDHSLENNCILVYVHSCLTNRRENMPNLYLDVQLPPLHPEIGPLRFLLDTRECGELVDGSGPKKGTDRLTGIVCLVQ